MKNPKMKIATTVLLIAYIQSATACLTEVPVDACGGNNGIIPWPVICTYYPLRIDACYVGQTVGQIKVCADIGDPTGALTDQITKRLCKYDQFYANCCDHAQHGLIHLSEWLDVSGCKSDSCPE